MAKAGKELKRDMELHSLDKINLKKQVGLQELQENLEHFQVGMVAILQELQQQLTTTHQQPNTTWANAGRCFWSFNRRWLKLGKEKKMLMELQELLQKIC